MSERLEALRELEAIVKSRALGEHDAPDGVRATYVAWMQIANDIKSMIEAEEQLANPVRADAKRYTERRNRLKKARLIP